MKTWIPAVTVTVVALMVAPPARAKGCFYEGSDPDAGRIFADVPAEHPLCEEIESLYRDGLTSGCGTNEDGELLYCPGQPITRAMAAAFVAPRDPFAQVDGQTGRLLIADHAAEAGKLETGVYTVQFRRIIATGCAYESWPHDWSGPGVRVRAILAWGLVDTLLVRTTINDTPVDMDFNVRVHCK